MENVLMPVLAFCGMGLLVGVLLTVASKVFAVESDETAEAVLSVLPGVNCGACGYAGCADYAAAVAKGADVSLCKPGGKEAADKIAAIMGTTAGEIVPQIAVVRCSGDAEGTSPKFSYKGIQSCTAADRFYSGSESCSYGCLGFGDCAKICPEEAIEVRDRLAKVDKTRCIGCGMCVKACPGGILMLRDVGKLYDVACCSENSGKDTRAVCKKGCIGCKICEKNCPEKAITVINNLARIDYSKCTNCGTCAEKCPRKTITCCKSA
jgi:Na+-translocating ferredoxin:NAD+ oxidoreductase RNF subunit RnfB